MFRKKIIEQLCLYKQQWCNESNTAETIIRLILKDPNCFERTNPIGHVTGSAWLVNKQGTHVLLTHHKKLNRWLQLGGHADGESNIVEVSMREAHEESGISRIEFVTDSIFDIDIHTIPQNEGEPEHYHYDIRYVMQAVETNRFVLSSESNVLKWVNIRDIRKYTQTDSMLRMAEKWHFLCSSAGNRKTIKYRTP